MIIITNFVGLFTQKKSTTGETDLLPLSTTGICDQVSRALQFLASRDIPHGNVAASNVVVVSTAESRVKVKLGDPGELSITPTDHWANAVFPTNVYVFPG